VIGALRKFFNVLLVYLGHLLLLYLELLFRLLENCYRNSFLRSCMIQMYKCSCIGALER
jgi:hypothetical protein